MLWIKDAPNLDTDEGRAAAPRFIDRYISTQIPPLGDIAARRRLRELVTIVQQHMHTFTCEKASSARSRGQNCRFYYPKPQSDETRLKLNTDRGLRSTDLYLTKHGPGDTMTVPYNPEVLLTWGANMDIQLIGKYQIEFV